MNAILISIQPKWCELIASGKKTVEIRKTKPKIQTPFKCYIYMTAGDAIYPVTINGEPYTCSNVGGKVVIGEFVCDEITPLFNVATTSWNLLAGNVHEYGKALVRMARLSEEEMHDYAKGKNCYAWHISDLVIYDKPKSIGEFCKPCDPDPQCDCQYCIAHGRSPSMTIKRAPQSWCYVEERR